MKKVCPYKFREYFSSFKSVCEKPRNRGHSALRFQVKTCRGPASSHRAGGTYSSEKASGFSSLSNHWNPLKGGFDILNSGHG